MKCEAGYYLDNFQCVLYNAGAASFCDDCTAITISTNGAECFLDLQDMTCKRIHMRYDNPCSPGTFNAYTSSSQPAQCQDC